MSPNTLIFGGSGKVARHITRLLASEEKHTVHSIIRKPEQESDIKSLGGKPIVQSIEASSVQDFTQTIKSTNATTVLWAAGAGGGNPERTRAVDNEGAIKAMDATAAAGVRRFILISAVDVRNRASKPEPEWYNDSDRERSNGVWKAIGPYMEAKFAADRNLVTENGRRGLEYTIVRPGGLSQEPGKGTIAAGKVHLKEQISREDVARVVIECMKQEGTKGLAFDCVGGGTPIADAVAEVAKGRVNTFAGRY